MSLAVIDNAAFDAVIHVVHQEIKSLQELVVAERVLRTIVLHDEVLVDTEPTRHVEGLVGPIPDRPATEGDFVFHRFVTELVGSGAGFDYLYYAPEECFTPDVEIAPKLIELVSTYASDSAIHLDECLSYLKRVIAVSIHGGSAVLHGRLGRDALAAARQYPDCLFQHLDDEWQSYARSISEDGLGLSVPPVLAVVLTRAARRDAIPVIVRDLRLEWANAREKVWTLLHDLRECDTLEHALDIRRELAEASRMFSPERTELDIRPVRVLWEIVAAGTAGASVAALSGGKPVMGAVAGAVTQAARNLPAFSHEFGEVLFGRGAFDLARRVRRAVSEVELGALTRLLSDAEKQNLGFG